MNLSRLVILPYKLGSQSAKSLADSLSTQLNAKVRRVRPDCLYKPTPRSLIVNYGASQWPAWTPLSRTWLNKPSAVAVASNKLSAFRRFSEENIACPEWTTSQNQATDWMNLGSLILCRTMLNSHSGRGIILASTDLDQRTVLPAPLYVKYKKKRKEFRVHVFNGRVIDVQEKRKARDALDNPLRNFIRNHDNGWVFCRDSITCPDGLHSLAVDACRSLGLDFGAADIIWNESENKCYVLEVNTAPGLEGTTLTNYTNAIKTWMTAQ